MAIPQRFLALSLVLGSTSVAVAQGAPAPAPPPDLGPAVPPQAPPPEAPQAAPAPAVAPTGPAAAPSAAPAAAPTAAAPQGAPAYPPPAPYAYPPPGYAPAPPPVVPAGERHDGFYLRFSLGGGRSQYDFEVKNEGAINDATGTVTSGSASLDLMIGGTPAEGLVIGGALIGEGAATPESTDFSADGGPEGTLVFDGLSASFFGPFIDIYPDDSDGLHFIGGVGIGGVGFANACVDEKCTSGDPVVLHQANTGGFAAFLGLGYEWFVGEEWSLGVYARGSYVSATGETDDGGEVKATEFSVPTILFTVNHH